MNRHSLRPSPVPNESNLHGRFGVTRSRLRTARGLLGMLGLAVWLAACSPQSPATKDSSLERVLNAKELAMGFDPSFQPMTFCTDFNEYVGFDIDFAREVCKRMGVTLQLRPLRWVEKDTELANGHIDCIWGAFSLTSERMTRLRCSHPYIRNQQVVVVPADSTVYSLEDLHGLRVGVQAGAETAWLGIRQSGLENQLAAIQEFQDSLDALLDMETCGIDAAVLDSVHVQDVIRRSGKNYRILEQALSEEGYGVAFRRADTALAQAIQTHMAAMYHDGTLAALAQQWFGTAQNLIAPAEEPRP